MAIIAVTFKYKNRTYNRKFDENTIVRVALTELLKAAGENDTDPNDTTYTIMYRARNQINKGHVLSKTLKEAKIINASGVIVAIKNDENQKGKLIC